LRSPSFKFVAPKPAEFSVTRIADLIDRDKGVEDFYGRQHLLPIDADVIKTIPAM